MCDLREKPGWVQNVMQSHNLLAKHTIHASSECSEKYFANHDHVHFEANTDSWGNRIAPLHLGQLPTTPRLTLKYFSLITSCYAFVFNYQDYCSLRSQGWMECNIFEGFNTLQASLAWGRRKSRDVYQLHMHVHTTPSDNAILTTCHSLSAQYYSAG